MASARLAVDIGGTFTDVVLRSGSGQTWVDKTLTTPESLDIGFFRSVDSALAKAGIEAAAVTDVVVHATTVVTNAVIERKGPLTALLVTEGFNTVEELAFTPPDELAAIEGFDDAIDNGGETASHGLGDIVFHQNSLTQS